MQSRRYRKAYSFDRKNSLGGNQGTFTIPAICEVERYLVLIDGICNFGSPAIRQ
jgi:hypothetical protein